MDTESSSNFFHTAIKNSFPYATNIRTPDGCSAIKPVFVVEKAVKGMLPHNSIGAKSITRLKVYAGANHNQQAQQPINYEVK